VKINLLIVFVLITANLIFLAACSGQPPGQPESGGGASGGASANSLRGAGASFPSPLYLKWASEYQKLNPNAKIDYQSTGSGAGVNAILNKTVDFGASDAAMSDEDLKKAGAEILHIPTVLGAVVLTYNVEGIGGEPLKLSPETIADIYLGKIKKWNDPRIKADNPNANLPDKEIKPVYRADSSGTTDIFTDYLSKVSAEWKEKVGRNKQPSWIKGVGSASKGNEGVMGEVKQTPNSIGYVELIFAKSNNLPTAQIKNAAGNFVEPNTDSVTVAASESINKTPDDLRVEITNATGAKAYPISAYTYILIYKEQNDAARAKSLVDFLWWAIHDGQKFAKELQYAPLPPEIVAKTEARLKQVTSGGKTLKS
jgi:phosphate transport system substrate-binding protein